MQGCVKLKRHSLFWLFCSEASCYNSGKRMFPWEQQCSLLPLQQQNCFGLSTRQDILVRDKQKDLLRKNSEDTQIRNRYNISRDKKPKMRHLGTRLETWISTRIFRGSDHLCLPAVHGLNRISSSLTCGIVLVDVRHSCICHTVCTCLRQASPVPKYGSNVNAIIGTS